MTKVLAWLAVAMLAVLAPTSLAHAQASEPLKPYVVFILDTSGSMVPGNNNPGTTGSGPTTCGSPDTKLNHAKCAINNIANSYGDMVFALGRFRMSMSGTTTASTFPTGCASDQSACSSEDDKFELLTSLVDGQNSLAASWTSFTGNTCTATGTDPEVWRASGSTPLAGSLNGAKRYWIGEQATDGTTIWSSAAPGFNPIRNDATNRSFLPRPSANASTCNSNQSTCTSAANCTGANCCCASQCRPYIVILLTDGAASCGTASTAAASLLATDLTVGGVSRRYRIETKPIAFGADADPVDIEAIAHAGGAPDGPGNEGFYAADEAELQLAISSILDDAIRTETCNNLDDDCDLIVDEGFPNKGAACDNGRLGVCRRTGTLLCSADGSGLTCNAAAGPAAGTETCNTLDDDCDGLVDEGLAGCTCTPQGEACDNDDDDCDGRIDEGLTRACGTGTCLGTETCVAGGYAGCTAQPATAETCNGTDDNCDGVIDGITLACSNIVTPGGPATDNPGGNPASACSLLGAQCICRPGIKSCPANGSGMFGSCLNEQTPLTEVCNNLDDDCDGRVDEGTGGADCSTNCGVGTTVCINGTLMCNSVSAPDDDTCDGNDDDCDGSVDEDYMSPGACDVGLVCNGLEQCINGVETCIGEPILEEVCNCEDDDCDGMEDEGDLCGGGADCVSCQCAFRCTPGEFPCPSGKYCDANNYCVADPCFNQVCDPVAGVPEVCVPTGPTTFDCVPICDTVTCSGTTVCRPETGECVANDCSAFPERCTAMQNCVAGVCVDNPCQGVTCEAGQYCSSGTCIESCATVDCPDGQRCRLGMCEADPCGAPCPFGQACNEAAGVCVTDACGPVVCQVGEACVPSTGECIPDPCVGTMCPGEGQVCVLGTCYDPGMFQPDAGTPQIVTTGGGGGSGCNTSSGNAGSGSLLALALVGLLRRRKRGGRS